MDKCALFVARQVVFGKISDRFKCDLICESINDILIKIQNDYRTRKTLNDVAKLTIDNILRVEDVLNEMLKDGIINYGRFCSFLAYAKELRKEIGSSVDGDDRFKKFEYEMLIIKLSNEKFHDVVKTIMLLN